VFLFRKVLMAAVAIATDLLAVPTAGYAGRCFEIDQARTAIARFNATLSRVKASMECTEAQAARLEELDRLSLEIGSIHARAEKNPACERISPSRDSGNEAQVFRRAASSCRQLLATTRSVQRTTPAPAQTAPQTRRAQTQERTLLLGNRPAPRAVQPAVSDSCLRVGQSSTTWGNCDGHGGLWFWTTIAASHQPGCPSSVEFTYREPDTGKMSGPWYTSYRAQTCGGPPQDVHAR
jgi:hypothetical protein